MEVVKKSSSDNDYPVAYALNAIAAQMILCIVMADVVGLPEDHNVNDLNRAYILLINELQQVYDGNLTLSEIKPEPVWRRFDVLKTSSWDITQYLENPDNDAGNAHNARVEKLCIITGKGSPDYTPEQNQLLENTDKVLAPYLEMISSTNTEKLNKKYDNWHIPEYTLTYKPDGTIIVNEVLKLKKIHAGSTTERLLEQAIKNPNMLFKPDLGQTSRNLSTILNSAGFTKELRDLFFPTVSNSKGVVFRPIVTRDQAIIENINTIELDLKLRELGVTTQPTNSI